ncbi:hypothetical protein AAFF_G00045510 [Aldrovandia affinis]|uniref:Uncharacterized protein n=1 Tax=Aldrovandia affinis TaxID=143900 RepID=A0AAD7WEW0_9TELE|nr:hypothetical protein AAFF_G00045510 [Aldrovandia affinis]
MCGMNCYTFRWSASSKHTEYDRIPPYGGMPAPEQTTAMEEGLSIREGATGHNMEPDTNATNILASVKEQFKRAQSSLK